MISLLGKNQLEVKDQTGHVRQVHITDVKKTTMPEVIAKAVPDYIQFGTKGTPFQTKKQDTSWFWSITEKFKEGLHHQVLSDDLKNLPFCSD